MFGSFLRRPHVVESKRIADFTPCADQLVIRSLVFMGKQFPDAPTQRFDSSSDTVKNIWAECSKKVYDV